MLISITQKSKMGYYSSSKNKMLGKRVGYYALEDEIVGDYSSEDDMLLENLVVDYIESTSHSSSSFTSSPSPPPHEATFRNLQVCLKDVDNLEKLVLAKTMYFKNKDKSESKQTSSGLHEGIVMRLRNDGFHASVYTNTTCWSNLYCHCPWGVYKYIEVVVKGEDDSETRLIVDIDFKSQFELARPTEAYEKLIDLVPSTFVGSEEKLLRLVSLLCSACQDSLKESGLDVPPWRTATYLESKWISKNKDQKHEAKGGGGECSSYKVTKWSPPRLMNQVPKTSRGDSALTLLFSNPPPRLNPVPATRKFRGQSSFTLLFSNPGFFW